MLSIPLFRGLWAAAVILVAGHLLTLYLDLEHGVTREHSVPRQFDLNGEGNLAAWFQSFLLLLCALSVLALASHYRARRAPLAHRWVALSGLFALMAIDETAQLHDMFTGPLRRGLEIDFGIFYFAWLLPAVAFLAACAWYFAPIALSLPGTVHRRLLVAVGVYLSGAVVVEMISGFVVESGRQSTPYHLVLTIEESCEIAGITLVLGALAAMVRLVQPSTTISLLDAGRVGISPVPGVSSEPPG